jgi:HNH endonuclease
MFATNDSGQILDAEYVVEREGEQLALILSSSSGPAGTRPARNTAYRPALALLLARLRDLGAVIEDALVDSRSTQRHGTPEALRRLISSPIRLVEEPDIEAVRLRLTSAQARVDQAPGASKGGNSSKRIRLRLHVPGFPPDAAGRLEAALADPSADGAGIFHSPEEVPDGQTFPEGTLGRIEVNRYERDRRARRLCLAHWGYQCSICDLDFGERYGELGEDFIHVHHTVELSTVGPGYRVDPVNDLRPVCPNCHAMVHRRRPALSVDELRQILGARQASHNVSQTERTASDPDIPIGHAADPDLRIQTPGH